MHSSIFILTVEVGVWHIRIIWLSPITDSIVFCLFTNVYYIFHRLWWWLASQVFVQNVFTVGGKNVFVCLLLTWKLIDLFTLLSLWKGIKVDTFTYTDINKLYKSEGFPSLPVIFWLQFIYNSYINGKISCPTYRPIILCSEM